MTYEMYADAYVECGDGWRWRFHITDAAGLFEISYEEWNEQAREWKPKGKAEALHVQAIQQIIDALKLLSQ